jgi:mono/diheme cytochrome c family protein
MNRIWLPAIAVAAALSGACRQDMHDAPRYDPLEASAMMPGGASAQPLVEGTVARDHLKADALLETGKINGQVADVYPFPIAATDLNRGQERFDIFCSPCHGRRGEGDGMVVQRGYREPPSLHLDRLRTAPVGHYFDVITNGFGAMPDYAALIRPEDRWASAGYIRALQLSAHAALSDVPADQRGTLK